LGEFVQNKHQESAIYPSLLPCDIGDLAFFEGIGTPQETLETAFVMSWFALHTYMVKFF